MIDIDFRMYNPAKSIEKNILYKISDSCDIQFVEQHEQGSETVDIKYDLQEEQYGIYANEYRRPGTKKEGCKTADVLSCIIDKNKKEIKSLIFDVKSNISAFSDDLTKSVAVLTAIKSVRDFIEQIRAEILHKDSFLLYFKADNYSEQEEIGIVTKNFEAEKFRAVANRVDEIMATDEENIPSLVLYKLKNSLKAYAQETETLNDFAERKVLIMGKLYQMKVFLLHRVDELDFRTTIQLSLN